MRVARQDERSPNGSARGNRRGSRGSPRGGGRRSVENPRWARRLLAGAVAAVLVAGALAVAAAWVAGPSTTDAEARIGARMRAEHVHGVSLSAVAPVMREAVVATEDERFWRHHGVDVVGVARAFAYDVSHLSTAQGASTITEQLVKQLYLGGNDHSPWLKLRDAVGAFRMERHLSKDQILAAYLNTVLFGHGAYGVANASRVFFGVPPSRLDLAQASLLAGLIQAPGAYDPLTNPTAARWRQVEVLRSMVRNGYITEPEGERVLTSPLPLSGGHALPPLAGVSLAPGSALIGGLMLLGLALLAAALAWRYLAKRMRLPWLVRASWLVVAAAGLVAIARSLQVV